jgi:hypothetical protein
MWESEGGLLSPLWHVQDLAVVAQGSSRHRIRQPAGGAARALKDTRGQRQQ